jgi:hypothetical protein
LSSIVKSRGMLVKLLFVVDGRFRFCGICVTSLARRANHHFFNRDSNLFVCDILYIIFSAEHVLDGTMVT